LLIVVLILAIISAALVAGGSAFTRDRAREASERLVRVWQAMCVQVRMDARPLGLRIEQNSYEVLEMGIGRRWLSVRSGYFASHPLAEPIALELEPPTEPDQADSGPQIFCDATALAIQLRDGTEARFRVSIETNTGEPVMTELRSQP
jgi:hypothetical protein